MNITGWWNGGEYCRLVVVQSAQRYLMHNIFKSPKVAADLEKFLSSEGLVFCSISTTILLSHSSYSILSIKTLFLAKQVLCTVMLTNA